MKIVVTGATGLVGKVLSQLILSRGDQLIVFSRDPKSAGNTIAGAQAYVEWDYKKPTEWYKHLNGADAVIHLAGQSLFGNLASDSYKKEILETRVHSTENFLSAFQKCDIKPGAFISASAIGYYGATNLDEVAFTEDDERGAGFLSEVCAEWEEAASRAQDFGIRTVSVRVGIVLDKYEGALEKLLLPFNLYLGGNIGEGNQWLSWIHKKDTADIFLHALDKHDLTGPINAVAPTPVRMKEFTDLIAKKLNKPVLIKIPESPLRALMGDASLPVTEGIKVFPKRALESGFRFRFNTIEEALDNLM